MTVVKFSVFLHVVYILLHRIVVIHAPGVPEVLSIAFSSINQKVYIAGRKTKYQHNLHLMAIQIKTEQSRKVII